MPQRYPTGVFRVLMNMSRTCCSPHSIRLAPMALYLFYVLQYIMLVDSLFPNPSPAQAIQFIHLRVETGAL